jgi:starvation-inducible DNA-binding protein
MASKSLPSYTVPSLTPEEGAKVAAVLQERLNALNDLALTLKHVHWNVVGPHFIAVHEMLDPQVDAVRLQADEVAERIATLGVAPVGTPGALVESRTWEDYKLNRAGAIDHLHALDHVYVGLISSHREAADAIEDLDLISNDLLVGHLHDLEKFHWFIRAHLESAGGVLSDDGPGKDE